MLEVGLRQHRVSRNYEDHFSYMPCSVPRWIEQVLGRFLPHSCGLPRLTGGSASTTSLSRPAQASLALRPAGSLARLKRTLSRGFDLASRPTKPLSSYHAYRQLHGWIPPPQVIFAVSAHCKPMGQMFESQLGSHSVFSNILAEESDRNRLSRCSSNQMHVQAMQHLVFSLFTAKIYSRSVHSCRHAGR